jgi:TATA-box binding protein (TBP) (component of TFIID and TFIIIB)
MTTVAATPLRISTMTVTGDLGAIPNLRRLYEHPGIIPYWWIGEGILKIEFAGERKGQCMEDILHVSTKEKKRFFNQSSLVFRLSLSEEAGWKETNIKLFKNGGFQMTGINSEEMARAALTRLIAMYRDIWPVDSTPYIKKFDTCLINSDYALPDKAIHRDRLYHILVEEYGIWSTYDPTRYQGVNAKFFWNKARPADAPPGICLCPVPCSGDGAGYAIGDCKKITIAPFRTGKIIITGAKFMEQLEDAYAFINGVFAKHADEVLRDPVADTPVTPAGKPKRLTAPLTTPEALVRQRMRTSPRNIVRLGAVSVSGPYAVSSCAPTAVSTA